MIWCSAPCADCTPWSSTKPGGALRRPRPSSESRTPEYRHAPVMHPNTLISPMMEMSGEEGRMTFNRYMFLRMIVEFVGVICCTVQLFSGTNLVGLIITGVIALLWAGGEIWVATILNRKSPRRDELSDEHQKQATEFAFMTILTLLVALGFLLMALSLVWHTAIGFPPIGLPAIAMTALVISDARYLWLEHSGSGAIDED